MRIPVRTEGERKFINTLLIDRVPAVTAREWRKLLTRQSSDQQHDSVEFLESAVSKWKLYDHRNRVATSQRQLVQMINNHPKIDLLGVLDAQAEWSPIGRRLGVCQFRRTWSNSIAIDFLAVHPALLAPQRQVSGVGTALLYGVAQIARRIGAERIWLETTDLSVGYYTHLFGTAVTYDLMIAPTTQFYDSLRNYFGEAPD